MKARLSIQWMRGQIWVMIGIYGFDPWLLFGDYLRGCDYYAAKVEYL